MELTYFLAVHGLAGDSVDNRYQGWFNIRDFNFGIMLEGGPDFKPLEITVPSDAGLVGWLSRTAAGQVIPSIVIEGVLRGDGTSFVVYKLDSPMLLSTRSQKRQWRMVWRQDIN